MAKLTKKRSEMHALDFGRHLGNAVSEPGAGNDPPDRDFLRRDLLREPVLNAVLARLDRSMIAITAVAAAAELWQCDLAGHIAAYAAVVVVVLQADAYRATAVRRGVVARRIARRILALAMSATIDTPVAANQAAGRTESTPTAF